MRFILAFALVPIFALLHVSYGQQICGRISESDGKTPIEFAQVLELNTANGTISNISGEFCIDVTGKGVLEISHIGYETVRMEPGIGKYLIINLTKTESIFPAAIIQPNYILRDSFFSVGSGTSINERQLKLLNYTDINRMASTIAGVNIQEEDGFGLRPNIGMRGSGSTRSSKITLMEDGILMAPAPYAAAAAYYFPTMGRMQGIEILKGAAQIPYGPNTTGGAINLISAQFTDKLATQFWMETGSFGTSTVHTRISNRYKNFVYLAEYFNYRSNGFKTLENGKNTGFNKTDYLVKLGYNWGSKSKQNLTLKLGKTDETSNETYLGTTIEDFNKSPFQRYAGSQMDNFVGEHKQMSLRYGMISKKGMEFSVVAYRNNFHRNWYKLDKVKDTSGTNVGIAAIVESSNNLNYLLGVLRGQNSLTGGMEVKANNRDYYAQGIQANFGYRLPNLKVRQYIHGGIRYHEDGLDRFQWTDLYSMVSGEMQLTKNGTPGTESNLLLDAKALSGFVQYDVTVGKWQLNPGIRYEQIQLGEVNYGKKDPERSGTNQVKDDNTNEVIIPGLGIKYNINNLLSGIAGVHRGYTPSSIDSGALPEQSVNSELGIIFKKSNANFKIIGFHTAYENLLTTDAASSGGSGSLKSYNGGKAVSYGVELESGFVLYTNNKKNFKIPMNVTYTYTHAEFQSDFASDFEGWGTIKNHDEIPYVAEHQANALISIVSKYGNLTFNNRFTSRVRTKAGQGEFTDLNSINPIFLTDLNLQLNVGAGTRLLFGINNLWNNQYVASTWPAGYRAGMPRYIHGGIRFNL